MIKIILTIWRFFLYIADSLLLFQSVPPRKPSAKKNVLIMRLDGIGDFILWLDCAKEYSNIFPEKDFKLTLLGNIIWKDIADNLPFFDSFMFFERKKFLRNPFYRYSLLKKIRDEGFDVVIQARYSGEFIIDDAIIRTSKAQKRIGLEGDSANIQKWQKRISRRWYTNLVKTSKKNLPELLRNEELVHALGAKNFKAGLPRLEVNKNTLNSFKELPDKYYILAPGARGHWKKWPAQKFSQLADKIYSCCNLTGIICGSLSEKTISSQIISRSSSKLLDFTGLTSLPDLIAMIKNACFLVSNDSAAIHIAAAVDTPSICILGGGHYGRFMPYDKSALNAGNLPVPVIYKMDCFGCDWKKKYCKQNNSIAPCIEKISVDDVWSETQKIIETYNQKKT
jgi:ADP-heptose:LPS heptosyltransferase